MAFNSKRIFVQNSFFQAIVISIIVSTIHFKVNATNEHLDKLINNEKDENHNRNHEIDISTNNDRILAANEYKTMNSLDNDQINRHIPELSRINKRSWQNLQGSWGKRDAYGKSSIDDDIIGVDGSNSNFHGYAEPGLDEYEDLLLALSKQHQQQPYYSNQDIIDLIRTFPERSNNDDNLARNLQKRAWKNLSDGWGKRLVSKNLGHRNINGGWGKREPGWNNLKGLWGKRSGWNKLNSGWGKRDQSSLSAADEQSVTDALAAQANYY